MKKDRLTLTEGDVFRILVFQDERSTEELAQLFGLSYRNTLSTYYRMSKLDPKLKEKSCDIFNVTPDVFSTGEILRTMEDAVRDARECKEMQKTLHRRIDAMQMQIDALTAENLLLRGATPN